MNITNYREEIAVIYSNCVELDADGHPLVTKQFVQPFRGAKAKVKAFALLESIRDDFPESKGWHHFVWGNAAASNAYAAWVLGEDEASCSGTCDFYADGTVATADERCRLHHD